MNVKKDTGINRPAMIVLIILTVLCIVAAVVMNSSLGQSICNTYSEKDLIQSIEANDYQKIVKAYNAIIAGNEEKESQYNSIIEQKMDGIITAWSTEEIDYDTASRVLSQLQKIDNKNLSTEAKKNLRFISVETKGNASYAEAEEQFEKADYYQALVALSEIDPSYSQYFYVKDFKDECETILLALISSPTTREEYADYEKKIDLYLAVDDSEAFRARKAELEAQRDDFYNAAPILEKAKADYDKDNYAVAFNELENGLSHFPGNPFLKDTLDEYHNTYIAWIAQNITDAIQKEQYKDALKIVDNAIETYDCDAFKDMRVYVKECKNPLYKAKNNVVEKIVSIKDKFVSGDVDVEKAKKEAGAYVTKSGKKFVLGSYDEDEITLLSASGEIATSIIGIDVAADVRDLSYDVTHWGEEDYFALCLATDAVALVPVIGTVKYLKYSKEASKGAQKSAKAIKVFFGGTTAAAKRTYKIIDNSTALTKNADESAIVFKEVSQHYEKIVTKNQALAGKRHPVTGVPFKNKEFTTKDGRRIAGVFPVFKSKADVVLAENMFRATSYEQEKQVIKQLQMRLEKGDLKGFSEVEKNSIRAGRIPDGYACNPSEESGLIQLIDKKTLEETPHTDGTEIWGAKSAFKIEVKEGQEYTTKNEVAAYLHKYHDLPPNFKKEKGILLTQGEAKKIKKLKGVEGVNPSEYYSPGKHIGGGTYNNDDAVVNALNSEKLPELSEGRRYIECDVDYTGKKRGKNRLVYSDDYSIVFATDNHYTKGSFSYSTDGGKTWKKYTAGEEIQL